MALKSGSTSSDYLLDSYSYNTTSKSDDGSNVTVNRTQSIPLTNQEKDFSSASFYNADGSIQYADINLSTSEVFQKGAPDLFMNNLANNPTYLDTIKKSSGFSNSTFSSNDPNQSTTNTGNSANQSDPINSNAKPSAANGKGLVYPESRSANLDYLKVTVIQYQPPGVASEGGQFSTPSTETRKQNRGQTIFLPMHPSITETSSVSWNEDRLNPIQARLANTAYNAIKNIGDVKPLEGAKQFAGDLKELASDLVNTPGMGNYLRAYFAGQAVGANIIGRKTGAVLNNNLELLFDGPTIRSFSYSYKFTPRSSSEAQIVKEIIRTFKTEMAVKKGKTNLFLVTPNVFELEYIYGKTGKQHPFLNKIKLCALTNFTVNYTPDGSYMTYQDGSMTSYDVSLQFSELEPIYRDDQESSDGMGY